MFKKTVVFIFIFSYLFIPFYVNAKPDQNPNFVSQSVFDQKIEELQNNLQDQINNIPNFSDQINNLVSQVEELGESLSNLVDTVSNLQVQVTSNTNSLNNLQATSFPVLPNAPNFKSVTFANWYVNSSGVTTKTFDATGYKYFWFAFDCQHESSLLVEYSNDNTNWYGQFYKSPKECKNGGNTTNFVMGKYYRVTVGPTNQSTNFVVAQARFYN